MPYSIHFQEAVYVTPVVDSDYGCAKNLHMHTSQADVMYAFYTPSKVPHKLGKMPNEIPSVLNPTTPAT